MKPLILLLGLLLLVSPALFSQDGDLSGSNDSSGLNDSSESNTAAESPAGKTLEERRLDTIRYGTENEIAALIQTLKTENVTYLDNELILLVQKTLNRSILSGVFSFFGDRDQGGLEERAVRALRDWDIEAADTVTSAVDYLGKVKAAAAVEPLQALLRSAERRFMAVSLRALGRIGGGNPGIAGGIAEYLIDYDENRDIGDENRRELIVALGDTGSRKGIPLLAEIVENPDERATIKMAALGALSKIGDPEGLEAVLAGVSSTDPNVRAAAVSALGPFSGSEVDQAILEAFRDSYYRTRIGAAQAAGARKLTAAVPYLGYRAEQDEVPQVKDEAIRALGAIGNAESMTILENLFKERRSADRVRILAGEVLIRENPGRYAGTVVIELDEAKTRNQTALYNGLLRVVSLARTAAVEALTRRLLSSGGVIERSYALDMAANNDFRGLIEEIRPLTDPKNGSLARKAQDVLEKLGGTTASD
jgi:HEAT repeat protein